MTGQAEAAKRRLEPNSAESLRDLIYELIVDPIGELGCAGPPECKTCPGGVHDTGMGRFSGVIEVWIDDQTYEIRVEKKTKGALKPGENAQ